MQQYENESRPKRICSSKLIFGLAQWVVIVEHVTPNGDIRLVEQGEYWKFSLRQGRFYRWFFVSLLLHHIEEILGLVRFPHCLGFGGDQKK